MSKSKFDLQHQAQNHSGRAHPGLVAVSGLGQRLGSASLCRGELGSWEAGELERSPNR